MNRRKMESYGGYLSFKTTSKQRKVVEQLADAQNLSLGEAARMILERGIIAPEEPSSGGSRGDLDADKDLRGIRGYRGLKRHLDEARACQGAYDALEAAWAEYQGEGKR